MSIGTSTKKAKKTRKKNLPPAFFIGLPLGRTVAGGMEIFANVEDVGCIFAGPRSGKSTAFAIPFILAGQGPVLVTSNKRDLHDHTRGIREKQGRVFTFDPQKIAVTTDQGWRLEPAREANTPMKARALAELFEAAEGSGAAAAAKAQGVDFFPERAKTLLRSLFLAASVSQGWTEESHTYAGRAFFMRDVLSWLAKPGDKDPEPLKILATTSFNAVSDELASIYSSAPQERSGVFSSAQLLVTCLSDTNVADWVNPRPGEESGLSGRDIFDPDKFMQGNNTLYSLSKNGYGSAKALVTTLTTAVLDAAEKQANTEYLGRLSSPMICVLDEAANVCPWPKLPELYSHYGSKGILIWTILQSWSQGARVWGEAGMDALFSASNHRIYAGGNIPGHLLKIVSEAVGSYYYTTPGSPGSGNSPAGPRQEHSDSIFDVSELSSLPRGRAVLLSAGNRASLLRTVPWQASPYKEQVLASVRKFDPNAEATLAEEFSEYQASIKDPDRVGAPAI